jgi:hypothetical protein
MLNPRRGAAQKPETACVGRGVNRESKWAWEAEREADLPLRLNTAILATGLAGADHAHAVWTARAVVALHDFLLSRLKTSAL